VIPFFIFFAVFGCNSLAHAKAGLGEAPFAAQFVFFSPVLLLGIAAVWLLLLSIWYSTQAIISPTKTNRKKLIYSGVIQVCFWCVLLVLAGSSGAVSLFVNVGRINYYSILPVSTVFFLTGLIRYWAFAVNPNKN